MKTEAVYLYWVSLNYNLLKRKLIGERMFCEDSFHDALVKMRDVVVSLFDYPNSKTLDKLFKELYRQYRSKSTSYNIKFAHYENDILEFIVNKVHAEDSDSDSDSYQSDMRAEQVKRLVNTFPVEHKNIMNLYADGMSMRNISTYTGLQESEIISSLRLVRETVINNLTK